MHRKPPAGNLNRDGIDGTMEIGPEPRPHLAVTGQQDADQSRLISIPVAGRLEKILLVAIVLIGESRRAARMGVDDAGHEPFIVGPLEQLDVRGGGPGDMPFTG